MMTAEQNPFRTDRFHGLDYQFAEDDWGRVLARLEASGYSGAIVGAHGHGKTTFLRELGVRLEEAGYGVRHLFLNDRQRRFSRKELEELLRDLASNDMVLLDGAEQMGWLDWHVFRRRVRRARGLVVTCHEGGLLPTLYECCTSLELLDDLLDRLVPEEAHIWRAEAHRLYSEHGADMREVWFSLYDRCAEG